MKDFVGKTAVVTGAASGMGRAFAERFAAAGMRVVLADIETAALDATLADFRARGFQAIGVTTDVTRQDSIRSLAARAVEAYGKVHMLFNNAGVEGYADGALWEATDKDPAWTFGVNFWGVVYGIQTFMPLLLEHGEDAYIVNTASATGVVRANTMYAITKHAVVALSEVLRAQLAERNTRVGITVLCPGVVNTRIFEGSRNRPSDLQNDRPPADAETGRQWRLRMKERSAAAMPPADVAEMVYSAVCNEQFYVLTDSDWDERIVARHTDIMQRR